MMKRSCLVVIFITLCAGLSSRTLAHDEDWGDANNPIDVNWIGDIARLEFDHEDADPWKGWGGMWLKNICGQPWGDFHFQIKSCNGSNIDNVDFLVDPAPELRIRTGSTPYSWVQVEDLTWQVDNDAAGGATLDLFFYDNPIEQGDWVWFKIYTDNTYYPHAAWFTISCYPTPVPEPTTIGLLGLGGLILLRKKK